MVGKTGYREAACSVSLAERLGFYAYQAELPHRFGNYQDIPIPITGVCVRNWNTESDGNGLQGGIR